LSRTHTRERTRGRAACGASAPTPSSCRRPPTDDASQINRRRLGARPHFRRRTTPPLRNIERRTSAGGRECSSGPADRGIAARAEPPNRVSRRSGAGARQSIRTAARASFRRRWLAAACGVALRANCGVLQPDRNVIHLRRLLGAGPAARIIVQGFEFHRCSPGRAGRRPNYAGRQASVLIVLALGLGDLCFLLIQFARWHAALQLSWGRGASGWLCVAMRCAERRPARPGLTAQLARLDERHCKLNWACYRPPRRAAPCFDWRRRLARLLPWPAAPSAGGPSLITETDARSIRAARWRRPSGGGGAH
jgi:hypothetical protein